MRKKLLLADDSITIQKVVELTFPSDEFEVVTAGNGRIAVDKAATFLPDIVLCDVIMPQLDGYQVCEALRASAELKNVPILLLNGAFEPYDADKAKAVGALGNVSKPFDPPALVARVKEILAAHSTVAVAAPAADAGGGSAEPVEEAPAEFEYDEAGTHPVSTVEVPLGVREMAARSMSLDAPVFATTAEPEVLNADVDPADFSETLHGPLDEEVAPVEELPAMEVPEVEAPAAEEPVAASEEEEIEPIAATGEFEAPEELSGADTEPVEFDASPSEPEPTPAPAVPEFAGEHEFAPEELAASTAPDDADPQAAAEPDPEPMAVAEEAAPADVAEFEPAVDTEPEASIGLPAPPPAAAPPPPPPAVAAAASDDVAVPTDMVQQIAQRVISQVSERVIREIAWEVIPGLAEKLVKAEIERIKARAESERD